MKLKIIVMLVAIAELLGSRVIAQTNEIKLDTVTVKDKTYTNCTLSILNPIKGMILFSGGGATIKLQDLAEPYRTKYFNESDAIAFEKAESDKKSAQRAKNEASFREAREKFIEEYEPLRVINGELYDFSVLYQLASGGTWSSDSIAAVFIDWTVEGKVIQVLNDGLLVEESRLDRAVFLKNYRNKASKVDESSIMAFALPSGRYRYENTAGAEKTVYAFDCGRTYDPENDVFLTKTIMTCRAAAFYTAGGVASYAAFETNSPVLDSDKFVSQKLVLARTNRSAKNLESDKSTVSHVVADSKPVASGTGFFLTPDGYLISNNHVVKGATKIRLVTSAGTIDAKVIQVDAANDLALLKTVGRFAPLPIAASRTVKLGGTVATVGFPDIGLQGFAPKLAKGEIASLAGAADDPRYFQISVPVQPGNSGGALVDACGNVVGIVAAKLDASAALAATGALPENVNYAVKSSLLLSFLESVPDVAAKLKEPKSLQTAIPPFEDVVKAAQEAAVLVLVY